MALSNPLDEFEARVFADCVQEGLFPPQSKILLALSGGPDSTALFHTFLKLTKEWDLVPAVAHLNHKTRGNESDEDADFVRQLALENGLPWHFRECDVKDWVEKEGHSFQEGARLLRQGFFDELKKKEGYEFILLGHHSDDQAETVLMNLLRGTGSLGIAGMPFHRKSIVRPLLYRSRNEVLQYLERLKKPYRLDSSNEETRYLRNRLRRELIPHLQADYSPQFAAHLSQLSSLIREDEGFLAGLASEIFERIQKNHDRALFLPAAELVSLDKPILKRVLRKAVQKIKGNLKAVEYSHIHSIQQSLEHGSGTIVLPGDIRVSRENDGLLFEPLDRYGGKNSPNTTIEKIQLKIPGITEVPPGRVTIRAVINPSEEHFQDATTGEAFLDKDRVGDIIWVRYFEPGDRFWPLGGPGSKKLKSFFIDQKIPPEERLKTPILTDSKGNIIWVYGKRISDRFKVMPETTNVLYLKGVK